MRAIVRTGARLHLGFLDLHGGCGRRFGSIGVTLERPRCAVEATLAPPGAAPVHEGPIREILDRFEPEVRDLAVAVRVLETIPLHAGFGAGTQLQLAVALAAARVAGHPVSIRELARRLGRGQRSGIGVAAFEHGGLVIDAGHRTEDDPEPPAGEPPPVVFQHPLPDDWHFVLATPRAQPGLSGAAEQRAFADLPPMDAERVGRICRLALMQVAPAALTGDVAAFGAAITEIQDIVGDYFTPCQGGRYATRTGCDVAELARAHGARAVGQSSWGPTMFALVVGEAEAALLARRLDDALGSRLARLGVSRARNEGATCEVLP